MMGEMLIYKNHSEGFKCYIILSLTSIPNFQLSLSSKHSQLTYMSPSFSQLNYFKLPSTKYLLEVCVEWEGVITVSTSTRKHTQTQLDSVFFNKLMSFKIQCQNMMQLNMLVRFVMKHLCSC